MTLPSFIHFRLRKPKNTPGCCAPVFKVLKNYSGVSWPVAQALFSGTRARRAINFIRAIAENTEMESDRKRDLDEKFTQTLRSTHCGTLSSTTYVVQSKNLRRRTLPGDT